MYPAASLLNHSCDANTHVSFRGRKNDAGRFETLMPALIPVNGIFGAHVAREIGRGECARVRGCEGRRKDVEEWSSGCGARLIGGLRVEGCVGCVGWRCRVGRERA